MKTTPYFEHSVPLKHPEIMRYLDYVEEALTAYVEIETQPNGRTRRWIIVPEVERYLRVIVEPDGETVHNAMFDRNYARKMKRRARK